MAVTPRLRIAVVGGGLGGACLANALISQSHLDVHVFESKPKFSERGASLALGEPARKALDDIFNSVDELYKKAGGTKCNDTMLNIGSGPQAGEVLAEKRGSNGWVFQRKSLLRELIAPLPKNILHTRKAVTSITVLGDEKTELKFDDGAKDVFDAVIGADGIFSTVRKYILGASADEHAASPAGYWDSRILVSKDRARQVLGEKYFHDDRQWGWIGKDGFILHDVAENGTVVQCILCTAEPEPSPEGRKRALTRQFLTKRFQDWMQGPVAPGVIDLTLEQDQPSAYSQFEHKSTPTYSRGNVCVMGDAAHAMTPWMASGAATAFEDAMILGHILSSVTSPGHLKHAFAAYDGIRRPRCQDIVDASRGTGRIMSGQAEGVGLDPQKLLEALGSRWKFLGEFDVERHRSDALGLFEKLAGQMT